MSTCLSLDTDFVTVVRCAGPNRRIDIELTTSDGQVRAPDDCMASAALHVLRDCVARRVVSVHQVCGELLDAHVRRAIEIERNNRGAP